MIEPNDDNLLRLLTTALTVMASSFCENKSDITPTVNRMIGYSVQVVDDLALTGKELNVTELRDILTGLINEYNDSHTV